MNNPGERTAPVVDLRDVSRHFEVAGNTKVALAGVTFEVRAQEFVTVLGPSGCGKTTLLRILAGLLPLSSGQACVEGQVVRGPPPGVLILFQGYEKSLLPWRNVSSNVRFGLENQRMDTSERRRRVDEALAAVDLSEYRRHYPRQLSGGMQQRVAIARALACRPRILLMDEPFSSLDALTRAELQDLTLHLWMERRQTVLLVTHDVDEAVYMSSRVLVLSQRPGMLRAAVQVSLPYPRDQTWTREASAFLETRRYLYTLIRGEAGERRSERDPRIYA